MTASLWHVEGQLANASVWLPGAPEQVGPDVCDLAALAPVSFASARLGDNFTDSNNTLLVEHIMDLLDDGTPWEEAGGGTAINPFLYDGSLVSPLTNTSGQTVFAEVYGGSVYRITTAFHLAVFTDEPFETYISMYCTTLEDNAATVRLHFQRSVLEGPISVTPSYDLTTYGANNATVREIPTCAWIPIISVLELNSTGTYNLTFSINGTEEVIEFEPGWNLFNLDFTGLEIGFITTPEMGVRIADISLTMPSEG